MGAGEGLGYPAPMATPRRDFLKASIALTLAGGPFGALASAAPRRFRGPNGKLAVAKVAVGGMGEADLNEISRHPDVVIVGLCDVDKTILDAAGKADDGSNRFQDVPRFQDWREMFDKLGDRVDAVAVSTPDHNHAIVTLAALARGKHVYTQKPLARSASENRALASAAKANPKLVTQMGTQRSATAERRLAYELVRQGVVGKVKAIHAWTDRPAGWWPSGQQRPEGSDPVPPELAWDIWLGPAPKRPFKKGPYHPFNWRGTRDFGTGAFGDMACHILDMPYYGLDLGIPTSVHCDSSDGTDDEYPTQETVRMRFAPTDRTAAEGAELVWFDGGRYPDFKGLGLPESVKPSDKKEPDAAGFRPLPRDGAAILVGEGGLLVVPIGGESPYTVLDGKIKRYDNPHKGTNHWHDWVDACLGKDKARAPFEVAGVMCEALAIGAVASRFPGKELTYDQAGFAFQGIADSHAHLQFTPREGWPLAKG